MLRIESAKTTILNTAELKLRCWGFEKPKTKSDQCQFAVSTATLQMCKGPRKDSAGLCACLIWTEVTCRAVRESVPADALADVAAERNAAASGVAALPGAAAAEPGAASAGGSRAG